MEKIPYADCGAQGIILLHFLFGRSSAAEIKDGKQSRTAVSAYDYAERSDFDFADHRELRTDRGAHKLGVAEAVGVKNVYLSSRAVDRAQVAEYAVCDVLNGVFSAADLLRDFESAFVGNVQPLR